MHFINMPTFCPVICPQQGPPACAAAGCRTAQCPWAEQLHAVREGALWGLAQRALQEEQGKLNSEGLGRTRVLEAEGARGPHPARQLPSRPPLLPCWPLPVQLAPRLQGWAFCDHGHERLLGCCSWGWGWGRGSSAFLPPPLPSPFPESAPRGCHVHFCLYIPKFSPKLNLK